MATGLVYDHRYLEHGTGDHPENRRRLEAVVSYLQVTSLLDSLVLIEPRALREERLLEVHSPGMVERVRKTCAAGGGRIDMDTIVSGESFDIALLAAGGVVTAVDEVMRGAVDNAMALVRPPGHHATPSRSMGFCLFNNVALGARHLIREHGIERILCVDWDLHHGNGTQEIFYESPLVYYLSLHQGGFYPGTGAEEETGLAEGAGFTMNRPLPAGTNEEEYLEVFRESLRDAVERFSPEFILVSAGFDAHRDDPLGGLMVTEHGYGEMTRLVMETADIHCDGRLVSVLEGGYHLDALARSVRVHLGVLSEWRERGMNVGTKKRV